MWHPVLQEAIIGREILCHVQPASWPARHNNLATTCVFLETNPVGNKFRSESTLLQRIFGRYCFDE
ncbi:MAG: hypothetical protein CSB48_12290 [Proteobacteria bacterium]|nr:MAG: hypothetical protein CSB48_12290 [Pseudomonadota bacterium]